ncbi:MAG: N-6 DNA methylase [Bacteroidaceae bacterium]|nr:N-6 DNA methylase [Bacteroidaceae bacterium]
MAVTLSQNEISARAAKFAGDWKDTEREEAEAQSFLIEFFHVLGVSRKRVAIFEHKVKCADGGSGYIDLFWKGHILIEMKSRGKDLTKAYEQAKRYADSLAHHEFPQAILVCDFENWHFYDLTKDGQLTTFSLSELPQYIHLFHYLAGYEQREYQEEDPVNVQAAELLGKLHDRLKSIGYIGHPLEVYLVRLLFCLFADDTGIFRKDTFRTFIQDCTFEDGRDLAARLAELFQVLNTPEQQRLCTRDAIIKEFPYVNGGLFAEFLPMPAFDNDMRQVLLDCCSLDWSRISPAIFGSMFQSVMNAEERRALGAHYTSERNILKLINPLFMDGLREEFESILHDKSNRKASRLQAFHKKLTELNFLDPACGCGNFLVVAYRELRRLELSVIAEREKQESSGTGWMLSANDVCLVNVNQFYGIEIEEFPSQIAQVAMWLMDHQMNIEVGNYFGEAFARIPLSASATIVCENALRIDWESVVPKETLSYIMGNPPFIGKSYQSKEQKSDMALVFENVKSYGNLDFVASWFKKSADYIQGTQIECCFVATNSLCQGIAVPPLWNYMYEKGVEINFAYRSFKWNNEARGKATVHCVIVGFSLIERTKKLLYDDESYRVVSNINPYLVAYKNIIIDSRPHALCDVPPISVGSFAVDGGNLVMSEEEALDIVRQDSSLSKFIRPYLSPDDFINGKTRFCFWLKNKPLSILRTSSILRDRLKAVQSFRSSSKKVPTQKKASTPWLFGEDRQPDTDYILIPRTSSENRVYIPMGFISADIIAGDTIILPNATLYHFGILTSSMHMAWMKTVCGRLEMRYRYSGNMAYNNFPWPKVTEAQQAKISELAQSVLDARALYPDSSLADLYDPLTMPLELQQAHRKLDAAVEKAYGRKFADDADRVAFLFEKYCELVSKQ